MPQNTITDIISAFNALLGFSIMIVTILNIVRHDYSSYRWLDKIMIFIGAMWGLIYGFALLAEEFESYTNFGPTVVRPAITLTLGILLARQVFVWFKKKPAGKNHAKEQKYANNLE